MKLWILRPVKDDALWEPWYDKTFGFVVRAETEQAARAFAQDGGGDEVRRGYSDRPQHPAWTDASHSTCEPLEMGGLDGIIMEDSHAA